MKRPKSAKPRKQRKFLREAPLHLRRKILSAHLSKELRKQYKRRSLPLRKGDEVEIMRGIFAGKTAKVARVDTKEYKVYLEGITRRRTIGTEVQVPIHPSNLKIINPVLDDEERRKILLRKVKEVVYEKPKEEKTEKKKIEEKPKEEKQKEEKVELQEVKYGEVEKAPSAKVLARSTKGVKVGRRPQRRIPSKV